MSMISSTKVLELLNTDRLTFLAAKMWLGMSYSEMYHPTVGAGEHQYLGGGSGGSTSHQHQAMMHEYNAPIMNDILHFQQHQHQQQQQHNHHHHQIINLPPSTQQHASLTGGGSRSDASSSNHVVVGRGGAHNRGGRRTEKRGGANYSRGGGKCVAGNRTGSDKQ